MTTINLQAANVQKEAESTYNVYESTMQSHKLVRTDGKAISVIGGKIITNDKKDIEFLDAEIEAGLIYLRPATQVTSTDLDPMSKLRAQMKAEAREEILAETKDSTSEAAKVKPASTATLAALSAGSNSASAK